MTLRLIPIVLFGAVALLALKGLDALGMRDAGPVSQALAQNAPPPAAPATAPAAPAQAQPTSAPATAPAASAAGQSTEAILNERLAERRRQIEERGREIDTREALLRAAEQRLEERVQELRRLEQRIEQGVQQRQEEASQRLRGLLVMYENMKPRDAARIFDRLDMEVLVEMATRMNPRRMAEVLGEMSPEAGQRLTVELARRAGAVGQAQARPAPTPAAPAAGPRELPRIDSAPQRRPQG